MKYQAIVLVVFIGCLILAFLPLMMESDPEMQYYQAECRWLATKPEHKVCKADDMIIYLNLTKEDNLTQSEIDSLAREL